MNDSASDSGTSLWRAAGSLIIVAALAGFAVSYMAQSTRERISANQLEYSLRKLTEVLQPGSYNNAPHLDTVWLAAPELLGSTEALPAYRARMDGIHIATAVTVIAPDAYVGNIRLLAGIDIQGRLIAVRVLDHTETPGLGDKIELDKSAWITLLDGRQLADTRWSLSRDGGDFDQITGATITSRAVINAVQRALLLLQTYGETISAASPDDELLLTAPAD